jgi:uroporphyrin-3 C-methyltransferase
VKLEISSTDDRPGDPLGGPVVETATPARGGGSAAALLALLVALAALAGAGWLWWQDWTVVGPERQRLADQVARVEANDGARSVQLGALQGELAALSAVDSGAALADLRRDAAAETARLNGMEQSLAEQLALSRSLQAATAALQERLSAAEAVLARQSARDPGAAEELDLAEVDYLLRLASERLHLFADPAAADRTLEVADLHLAAIDNPAYFAVRQKIAASRQALAQAKVPDFSRLAAELDGIQAAVATWPFAGGPETAAPAAAGADAGWWDKLKSAVAGLVTVRRSAPGEAALSLEDQDYVRQRVWLQLEIAHLSLMRLDQPSFRSALNRAQDSLAAWFDADAAAVQSASAALAGLAAQDIEAVLPDITEPLTTLRLLRASAPPAGEAPAAAPLPAESSEESAGEALSEPAAEPPGGPADGRR